MRYTEKWSSLVYECVCESSFESSTKAARVFVLMLVDTSKRRTFPLVWWIGVLKCVQRLCCFVWRVFDTFDRFVVCLARVWHSFGIRCVIRFSESFYRGRLRSFAMDCNRFHAIAFLPFCLSLSLSYSCRPCFCFRVRFDISLIYREALGMCND